MADRGIDYSIYGDFKSGICEKSDHGLIPEKHMTAAVSNLVSLGESIGLHLWDSHPQLFL